MTSSFLSAHHSPDRAEICTRKSSGQRAGSEQAACQQQNCSHFSPYQTSLAAAQEPPPACPAGRDLSCTRGARRNHTWRDAITTTLCLNTGKKSSGCCSPGLCVTGAGWGVHHLLSFELSGSEELCRDAYRLSLDRGAKLLRATAAHLSGD